MYTRGGFYEREVGQSRRKAQCGAATGLDEWVIGLCQCVGFVSVEAVPRPAYYRTLGLGTSPSMRPQDPLLCWELGWERQDCCCWVRLSKSRPSRSTCGWPWSICGWPWPYLDPRLTPRIHDNRGTEVLSARSAGSIQDVAAGITAPIMATLAAHFTSSLQCSAVLERSRWGCLGRHKGHLGRFDRPDRHRSQPPPAPQQQDGANLHALGRGHALPVAGSRTSLEHTMGQACHNNKLLVRQRQTSASASKEHRRHCAMRPNGPTTLRLPLAAQHSTALRSTTSVHLINTHSSERHRSAPSLAM